jgi:hypothetical protein
MGKIRFKVRLYGLIRDQWYELASKLNNVILSDDRDVPVWKWTKSKKFTVKSVYEFLTKDDCGNSFFRVWRSKLPEKIKIFMWLAEQKAVLTKDNMLMRNWQGDPGCFFCGLPETNDHLFFEYPIAKVNWGIVALCLHQSTRPMSYEQYWDWIKQALPGGDKFYMLGLAAICWALWKPRNSACFEKKPLTNPFNVIFHACASFDTEQVCIPKKISSSSGMGLR